MMCNYELHCDALSDVGTDVPVLFFLFYYSMPHYMVILHALLNLIISFTFALNNKLYWMLFILVTSIIIF